MPTRHSSLKSNNCNALSPARQGLTRLPRPLGQGDVLAGPVSVARVRPRTSKGITAFVRSETLPTPASNAGPSVPRHIGSYYGSMVTHGISTYLKPPRSVVAHPFPRVATAWRYPGSPQDRPPVRLEAFPVPGGVARISQPRRPRLLPIIGGFPKGDSMLD